MSGPRSCGGTASAWPYRGSPSRCWRCSWSGRCELVSRDALCQGLWPDGTYVDFEHGLNAVVKRLRDALGDSAEAPRFVETLARRGYRFIAPVERTDGRTASGIGQTAWRARPMALLAAALAAAIAIRAFWSRSPGPGRG